MRTVYKFDAYLFETENAANDAERRVPNDWGSAYGGIDRRIEAVHIFSNSDEWAKYTGRR